LGRKQKEINVDLGGGGKRGGEEPSKKERGGRLGKMAKKEALRGITMVVGGGLVGG